MLCDATHLSRRFFQGSKAFLNSSLLMPFSASAVFCFPSSTSAKHSPLEAFSSSGETEGSHSGPARRIGRLGHRGHAVFGEKSLNTASSRRTLSVYISHHERGQRVESPQKFSEAARSPSQPRQLEHGCRWAPRHSPGGGCLCSMGPALRKILLGLLGPPKEVAGRAHFCTTVRERKRYHVQRRAPRLPPGGGGTWADMRLCPLGA